MLKLSNVTKIYGQGENVVVALAEVNVNFRDCEFVSVLGPSGCGKTTLLNIVGGLDRYTKGDLIINGVSTNDYDDKDWDAYRNASIGFVFQTYNLIPHQSVLENVELALTIGGLDRKQRTVKAKEALEKVGLASQIYKKPNQLSGGQMQRVAIARALVNDPDIILADEPTGALDSTSSRQVLDLLKEVARDRLVIMVTHNEELARRYSTRIISLLDGRIIGDTMPYTHVKEVESKRPKQSKMNIFTALKLSMRNLFSKRTRTFLTSFAGSIGIIGIALVLAVSNGFNIFMQSLQEDSMGEYPISIYSAVLDSEAMDFTKIQDFLNGDENTNQNETAYKPLAETGINVAKDVSWAAVGEEASKLQHKNNITHDYVDYIKQNVTTDNSKALVLNYGVDFNIFIRSGLSDDGEVKKIDIPYYSVAEMTSTMDLSKYQQYVSSLDAIYNSINWKSLLNDEQFIIDNYDILAGENFPNAYNQVALVVNENNCIDKTVLEVLGFTEEQMEAGFTQEDFVGKTFKIASNNAYYTYETAEVTKTITQEGQPDTTQTLKLLSLTPQANEDMYNSADTEQCITVTITAVVRAKDKVVYPSYKTGIVYTPMLTEKLIELNQAGNIAQETATADAIRIMSRPYSYTNPMGENVTTQRVTMAVVKNAANKADFAPYFTVLNVTEEWNVMEKKLGVSDVPSSIIIYAKDFDSKTKILAALNAYNDEKEEDDQILFSDTTGMLTGYMSVLIDGVSYVLITFAAISLVVSSIMIGIITYVSVVERTREIGVLRSLGASKRNVGAVFIAETFMIGLCSGLLGVGLSYLLSGIINLIMAGLVPALSTLATLNPLHALLLVVISFSLTMIAGLIPARIASKKDPVIALRTE